jgi:hypothetical protein
MAQPAADRQSHLVNNASGSADILAVAPVRYLHTMRKLLVVYQRARGVKQKQIFVNMMHSFMQELCGYPSTSYIVTNAVYSNTAADMYPHVVPTAYTPSLTLFYFTASADPDDVQDLWVKQAQVYLIDPRKEDFIAESATAVVFTNFFVIDGARKDPKTGAWNLWTVSDIQAAQGARVDLRILENETVLTPTMSQVVHKRLQTLLYQHPPDGREPEAERSKALAALMPAAHIEGRGA